MGDVCRIPQLTELEKIICKIRGVISSRIVTDEQNNISEIHILAATNRSPKQIVRDIETSLMIHADVAIDHKKVSIVQTQEDKQQDESKRPKLVSINLLASGLHAEAKVKLKLAGTLYEGESLGPNVSSNRLRLVAIATLDALETYLENKVKFVVEDIVKVPLGGKEAINVTVSMVTEQGEDILLGSAFIKNDDRDAVGKATLSAVNRKITLLT